MNNVLLNKLILIAGIILIFSGYCLLWISPDAELEEVIFRTRAAVVMNLFGAIFVVYYLYKR